MSMRKKIALVTLLIVFVTSLLFGSVLVACDNDKNEDGYSIYVKSLGGLGLSNVTVTVTKNGAAVASGTTDNNGLFSFVADPDVYDVAVSNLPLGYTLTGNNYKTSKDNDTLTILASSAVIAEPVPSDKVYKLGDVAYDFSVTDLTDENDPKVYTLSEILAEKKMVLLNFWNINCNPCTSEMPAMELAYRQYSDVAEVLAINVSGITGNDDAAKVRAFKKGRVYTDSDNNPYTLTFPVSLDDIDQNSMRYHYSISSIPLSVVIDRYGVVALIHLGSMDKSSFLSLFEKYTSDSYTQDQVGGGGGGDGDELVREKPNVSMPASSEIERAINGANFNGSYYPDTKSEDAEYSWPWLVGEATNAAGKTEKFIYPANTGKNYSFATISTSVTITQNDIDNNGNVVLAFDVMWSCENWGDYLFVIVNNTYVYSYTGTDDEGGWAGDETCYALVAKEPGDYELTLLYNKDPQLSVGYDTVRVKNMRMMSIASLNGSTPSLDMPRSAANMNRVTNQFEYVTAVRGDDGYYHKGTAEGPYLLADLMNTTNFNSRLQTGWGINQFATDGFFNYNVEKDSENPNYDPNLYDTDAITRWLMAANNSELNGLTVVNDELIELLNTFIKTQIPEKDFNDNVWLELCLYFDHYGYDKTDKGICDMTRNPIRGLLNVSAIPTVAAYEGELDLDNIPDEYKNDVTFDRIIVPRGLMYEFVPATSGVYRFRTQSKQDYDTMGWLYTYEGSLSHSSSDVNLALVSTDEQLENPDRDYNMVLTYYLEANQKYIFVTCFSYINVYGHSYTFTVERLGDEAYVWQYTGRKYLTYVEDEEGGVGQFVNYHNVEFAIGDDGYVYAAKRDANGKYITDDNGNYVPDKNDPLYVDFLTDARFFEQGSIEDVFRRSDKATVVKTVSNIVAKVWGIDSKPENGWTASKKLVEIKGSALDDDDWEDIMSQIFTIYGDGAYIDNKDLIAQLKKCSSVGDVADFLKLYYLDLFNVKYIRFDSSLGIPEDKYDDYTDLVYGHYLKAKANTGDATRGSYDAGTVKLTVELMQALEMFTRRVGDFPDIATEWISLCAHYQYMGPAAQ